MRVLTDNASAVYSLHGDHLGSVSMTTDTSGNILSQARFTPFGEVLEWAGSGTSPTDFGFTSQRKERGMGLMDYNARFYVASVGRFVSADSIVPGAGHPMAWDRYAYSANNPVKYNDPSGHCWGIASAIRGIPSYETTCSNLEMAWTIITHPKETFEQEDGSRAYVLAVAYTTAEVLAHVAVAIAGTELLIAAFEGSSGDGNEEWDITLEEFLAGREAYESEVTGIREQANRMLEEGYLLEDVAQWAYDRRREIGEQYKNLTPPDLREAIYDRNLERYGDPLGPPSIDYFLERGYSYEDIIDSASRPGGQDILPSLIERLLR